MNHDIPVREDQSKHIRFDSYARLEEDKDFIGGHDLLNLALQGVKFKQSPSSANKISQKAKRKRAKWKI